MTKPKPFGNIDSHRGALVAVDGATDSRFVTRKGDPEIGSYPITIDGRGTTGLELGISVHRDDHPSRCRERPLDPLGHDPYR